jgi:nucleotide-binding universal stress UspA family protein
MDLKDILVFLDAGKTCEARLELAKSIARDHGACLTGVFVEDERAEEPPPKSGVSQLGILAGLPAISAPDISKGAMLRDIAEQRFRDSLRFSGVEGNWHSLDQADMVELIALARAADLIIIGQMDPQARPAPAWRPDGVVIACGRPVLMVPYVGNYARVGHRVLVAWDGSREAARALNDALPLISAAEAVTLMSVHSRIKDLNRAPQSMERIVRHLARHGISARIEERLQYGASVSDVLLSSTVDLAVDMIVAGAYHHSPLREALTGGVSRELFHHMTVPVLMSH